MSNNKPILLYLTLLCLAVLAACQSSYQIPAAYDFGAGEIKKNPYGCWSGFMLNDSASTPVSGELICATSDTIFVLSADRQIETVLRYQIKSFQIYTHKNRSTTYGLITALYVAPSLIGAIAYSEYTLEFLALGLPAAIVGITQTAIESSHGKNVLYGTEKNSNFNFKPYARFPSERPPNVDFNQLTLKQ